jgi:hypothetical protein
MVLAGIQIVSAMSALEINCGDAVIPVQISA